MVRYVNTHSLLLTQLWPWHSPLVTFLPSSEIRLCPSIISHQARSTIPGMILYIYTPSVTVALFFTATNFSFSPLLSHNYQALLHSHGITQQRRLFTGTLFFNVSVTLAFTPPAPLKSASVLLFSHKHKCVHCFQRNSGLWLAQLRVSIPFLTSVFH